MDRSAETASPAAQRAAEQVLEVWRQIQKKAAWAGERVRWNVTAVTPYVLAKMRALVARVAKLAAQGTGWTLDQLLRLDALSLRDLAYYALLTLVTIGCSRDPLLLVRIGDAALSALLASVSGLLRMILRGLALMLGPVLCAVACWAWDLTRAVVTVVLNGLRWSEARAAEALAPSVEPAEPV